MKKLLFLIGILIIVTGCKIATVDDEKADLISNNTATSSSVTGSNGMKLSLIVTGENLNVTISGPTTGWISVGLAPTGARHEGSNIIIGYVKNGIAYIEDHYGDSATSHTKDITDNITNKSGTEIAGSTELSFTIPLDSKDSQDRPLTTGKVYTVILAYGENNSKDFVSMHKSAVTAQINIPLSTTINPITTDSTIKVTGILVTPVTATITAIGNTAKLNTTLIPENATNKNVTYKSQDVKIATVDNNGVVTAVAEGSTTILATSEDGAYTAQSIVTIKPGTVTTDYKSVKDSSTGITFKWRTNTDTIDIVLSVAATGWVSVGFDATKGRKHYNSDIKIGYVSNGNVYMRDDYSPSNTTHSSDTSNGGKDDLTNIKGTEVNGVTELSFSIPINPSDSNDAIIEKNVTSTIMLAYGTSDDFDSMHRRASYITVTF